MCVERRAWSFVSFHFTNTHTGSGRSPRQLSLSLAACSWESTRASIERCCRTARQKKSLITVIANLFFSIRGRLSVNGRGLGNPARPSYYSEPVGSIGLFLSVKETGILISQSRRRAKDQPHPTLFATPTPPLHHHQFHARHRRPCPPRPRSSSSTAPSRRTGRGFVCSVDLRGTRRLDGGTSTQTGPWRHSKSQRMWPRELSRAPG